MILQYPSQGARSGPSANTTRNPAIIHPKGLSTLFRDTAPVLKRVFPSAPAKTCGTVAMQVHVYLPSGKSCSVSLPSPDSSVRALKTEAQKQLNRRFLRLAFAGQQLDPSSTLHEAGVRDGDGIDAIVLPVKIASTERAFALFVTGGSALTWGYPGYGGDSSQVREKLARVQQIQATREAFAAILDDGSVVTWGNRSLGGDSSQAQHQLVRVQNLPEN